MFWSKAEKVSKLALENNTLVPIASKSFQFESEGHLCFGHTLSDNICKKPVVHAADRASISRKTNEPDRNPFLPYETDMYVADAGDAHVCILNKFPVITPHILICTREYVAQNQLLSLSDFSAWLMAYQCPSDDVTNADDILGFFNGGVMAGSSQPHRHMQVLKTDIPFEQVIAKGVLPFEHRLFVIDQLNASTLHKQYLTMMAELNLAPEFDTDICRPYNLLLTKRWMLMVPRSVNQVNGIYANGINFSGRFVVRNESQIEWLTQQGVLRFLGQCT